MKKTILILFLLSCFNNSFSQANDLNEMGLMGDIVTVKETSYKAIDKGDTIVLGKRKRAFEGGAGSDFLQCFDSSGRKVSEYYYNDNGNIALFYISEYNYIGLKLKWSSYLPDSTLNFEYKYEYNSQGIRTLSASFGKKGEQEILTQYMYDDNGLLVKESQSHSGGEMYSIEYVYEGNKLVKKIVNGSLSESFSYDTFGNKTAWVAYHHITGDTASLTTYKYYSDNSLFSMCSRDVTPRSKSQLMLDYCIETEYNEYGDIVKEIRIESNGKSRTYSFTYYYDSKGNWVRKIHFIEGKSQYIVVREIEYR